MRAPRHPTMADEPSRDWRPTITRSMQLRVVLAYRLLVGRLRNRTATIAVRESASPSVDHAPVAPSTGTATEIRFVAVVSLRSMQLLPCRKMRPGLKAGLGGLVPLHAMKLRLYPNDPILWS